MSEAKKKIGLKATGIHFGRHAITYTVELVGENLPEVDALIPLPIITSDDLKERDLVLKGTHLDPMEMEVSFVCVQVTTLFYQDVFNQSIKDPLEYESDKDAIYDQGDIVGWVML